MIETIKLHNGVSMPMEGFGVFQIRRLTANRLSQKQ